MLTRPAGWGVGLSVESTRADSADLDGAEKMRRRRRSTRFAAVEDAQHHDPVAVVAILEHVGSAEHLHHDLPVLLTRRDGATEFRVPGEQLRSADNFVCDDCRNLGGLILEERRESIEVGECIVRPIEVY